MKQVARFVLLLSIAFLICASPCLAKTKGYFYLVSYSAAQKKIYLSKVIIQKVRDVSYSEEEFVADVELIQKMEAQFLKHMDSVENTNSAAYTTAVRGAYKSQAIADKRHKAEREQFSKTGYLMKLLSDFEYSD